MTEIDTRLAERAKLLKDQTRQAYDWIAESYASEWSSRTDNQIVERFLGMVSPASRILDVGCGPGHYSRLFSKNGLAVVAADLSIGMLMEAQGIWQAGRLVQMDMQHMGFPSDSFDALWVCASFAHIPEHVVPHNLVELRRVVKDNGVLFINATVGNKLVRIETADEMRGYGKPGRFYQRYRSREHFERYLDEACFTVVDTITRMVHSRYDSVSDSSRIAPKAKYKVNKWVNFFCRVKKN